MNRKTPIELVEIVAQDLGVLCEDVVFVGGAIVSLLVTDPAAPPVSSTKDVDIIVSVSSRYAYTHELGDKLRKLRFSEDSDEGAPICRWRRRDGIKVDIMPIDPRILEFSNRWFPLAFSTASRHVLRNRCAIRVVTAPLFLATKIEAFASRGKDDYMGSKDIEDFLAVIHGRIEILDEIRNAPPEVYTYLSEQTREIISRADFSSAIEGHLPGEDTAMINARLVNLSKMAGSGPHQPRARSTPPNPRS